MVGEISDILRKDFTKCEDMAHRMEEAFPADPVCCSCDGIIFPIKRRKNNPRRARKAHIVPGGLNGGGNERETICSRRVAIVTEARAIDDDRTAADAKVVPGKDQQFGADFLVGSKLLFSYMPLSSPSFAPSPQYLLPGKSRRSHDDLDAVCRVAKYNAITTRSAAAMLPNALPIAASDSDA
mmetsp:Transcript_5017/g.12582  ORF Transcript_5017/g.12582 Transcript_5017/m.12582 type:complete len:182 (+) Transcript_5017:907-1452(+)